MKVKRSEWVAVQRRLHRLELKELMPGYSTCHGCGHLINYRHVTARIVNVRRREPGEIESYQNEHYGAGCDPGYDMREQDMDGSWWYFRRVGEDEYEQTQPRVAAPSTGEGETQ